MQDPPFLLALKAAALHLGGRTSDALEAIREAEALVCWPLAVSRINFP